MTPVRLSLPAAESSFEQAAPRSTASSTAKYEIYRFIIGRL